MAPDKQLSIQMEETKWYAEGTRTNAQTLVHTQRIGIPEGHLDPWTVEYMRQSVDIWLETSPESYVKRLAHSMSVFAAIMQVHRLDDGPHADWMLLVDQAESIVAAVTWRLPEFAAEPTNRLDRSDAPQGILRYDKLAALATRSGSVQLETAATNIIVYCLGRLHGDVTDEEIEWLRAFHDGARTVDVAAEHGYSERDFYRVLNRLWVKLDVAGRAEAIAQASKRGWLR
jgi:DNA-binding CsgD family transcriptional regulator